MTVRTSGRSATFDTALFTRSVRIAAVTSRPSISTRLRGELDRHAEGERRERRRVVESRPPLERRHGHRAVHRARVEVGPSLPERLRERPRDRALPAAGGAVDRDHGRRRRVPGHGREA
jgi:hypothetical protein